MMFMDNDSKPGRSPKLIIFCLVFLTVSALIVYYIVYYIPYYKTMGFMYPDDNVPPRKFYDSAEELKIATNGKYLMPDYLPREIDPAFNDDVLEDYTMYVGIGMITGMIIDHEKPEGWYNNLPEADYFIFSFGLKVFDESGVDVLHEDFGINEVVKVDGKDAGFLLDTFITSDFNNLEVSSARILFIGSSTMGDVSYNIGLSYICLNEENKFEIMEAIKNELIIMAESMITQGLPTV